MELSEKIQQLRANKGFTQEELAEQLFVSRTAVSKWESGRGLPSIDSLKAIAAFFGVSVDELLSGNELLQVAETEVKAKEKQYSVLLCGIMDCMTILLLFLPLFRQQTQSYIESVSLLVLRTEGDWLKISYLLLTALTAINGFAALILANLEKDIAGKCSRKFGLALTILTALLFTLSRQPYPAVFSLCSLICKGYLLLKSK